MQNNRHFLASEVNYFKKIMHIKILRTMLNLSNVAFSLQVINITHRLQFQTGCLSSTMFPFLRREVQCAKTSKTVWVNSGEHETCTNIKYK